MKTASQVPAGLPPLDPDSRQHLLHVEEYLREQVLAENGFMPFEEWMDKALYEPGLGYYAAGNTKFGGALPTGDFTTAPELTPLFGQTLARQVAQVLKLAESTTVLEFGAGSGALAEAIIPALQDLGVHVQYQILEVSGDLRARQQQRLAPFGAQVAWLDALPGGFKGCVLANEVLDAMPVTLFRWNDKGALMEIGVRLANAGSATETPFLFAEREASENLSRTVGARMPPLPTYQSEINLRAEAWVAQMGSWLRRGAALLIDYGFPQREYYHPQRSEGTLMCHFRHYAHSQPLIYPGLQDITAHVDFTAMADAALQGGLDVLGYTSQARFLMNAGLPDVLAELDLAQANASPEGDESVRPRAASLAAHAQTMAAMQKLISEAEMGELFKVLAIGRDLDEPLIGFSRGDRRDRL